MASSEEKQKKLGKDSTIFYMVIGLIIFAVLVLLGIIIFFSRRGPKEVNESVTYS